MMFSVHITIAVVVVVIVTMFAVGLLEVMTYCKWVVAVIMKIVLRVVLMKVMT